MAIDNIHGTSVPTSIDITAVCNGSGLGCVALLLCTFAFTSAASADTLVCADVYASLKTQGEAWKAEGLRLTRGCLASLCWSNSPGHLDRWNPPGREI